MNARFSQLRLSWFQLAVLAGITLLLVLGFGYVGRLIATAEMQAQVAQWEADVAIQRQVVADSEAQLERVQTDQYVEETARTDLGWTKEGDMAIRVLGEPEAAAGTAVATPSRQPAWRLWWERFFGP